MGETKIFRGRGLPFTLTTTEYGLLLVADGNGNELFTYCPWLGVMHGLGDFDDNPRMYTPKALQLFNSPVADLQRMKSEWQLAADQNDRQERVYKDAPLPFIAQLDEAVLVESTDSALLAFEEACAVIEAECADEV